MLKSRLMILAGSVAGLVILVYAAHAYANTAPNQDFTLFNETGFAITRLQISPANSDKWGPNWLSGALPSRTSVRIDFSGSGYAPTDCLFDVKIHRGSDDVSFIVEDLNTCELDQVVFTSKGNKVFFHKY